MATSNNSATEVDDSSDLLMTRAAEPPVDEASEGPSGWKKAGVGAGIAAGTGLLAYAFFRVGAHFGWWGDKAGGIVFDEADSTPSEAEGSSGNEGSSGGSGGSSSKGKRATGKPPNMSGDSAGYNTSLFSAHAAVRIAINKLGYSVTYDGGELSPNGQSNPEVSRFQSDWNKVIRGLDSGKVKFPTGVKDTSRLSYYRGTLGVDGITGRNTFNALEIAFTNQQDNQVKFHDLVKQAKA